MSSNIHKKVLTRLFLGWVGFSLLLGSVVFFWEMEKVDDHVLALATQEAGTFTSETLGHFNRIDETHPEVLQQIKAKADEFLKNHFTVIELYNRNKQQFLEVTDPGMEALENELKRYVHKFPLEDSVQYKKFYINSHIYMQVLLPLKDGGDHLAGYFEGVYEVDDATFSNIRHDVIRTLLLVVVTIFATSVMLYPIIISLNQGLVKLSGDLLKGNIELMEVLGSAIAKRDSDTNIHNYRVTIYAIRLAEALGHSSAEIRGLISGAFLHDVGKIGVSDNILLKPGRLTEEEFAVMRNHVLFGVEIIAKSNWLESARDVVEFHHEKFDGSGYMRGLRGEEIPLNARIFAIVDVFDALTSRRPYKEPYSFEEAMSILRRDSGSHFDPAIMKHFEGLARDLHLSTSRATDLEVEMELNHLLQKHFFSQ
ncbi:MAG: HD-GYP domain-containing protein [Sulfuricella denitrificans]|nr:HD-GYP domain-containing protein [Sulfuricella denitrificans]